MKTVEPTPELQESIRDDEEIQWVVRPHALGQLLGGVAMEGLVAVMLGSVLGGIAYFVIERVYGAPSMATAAGAVIFLLGFVWVAYKPPLRFLVGTTEYAATDKRILKLEQVTGQKLTSVPLEGVQDAEYSIAFVENLFDVGTVSLDTDKGYGGISFPYTPSPAEFTRAVSEATQQSRTRHGPGEYTPSDELATTEPDAELTENLYPDEELLWVVRPDRTTRLVAKLPHLVYKVVLWSVIVGTAAFYFADSSAVAMLAGGLVAGYLLFSGGKSVALEFIYGTRQYAATDRRIISYSGRFGKGCASIPLVGIQDAEYDSSTLRSWLGIGTVTLDTGLGYGTMSIGDIATPPVVAREIGRLAASGVAYRPATDPSDLDVGDGITSEPPSDGLRENIPDDQVVYWVLTPDHRAKFLSSVTKMLTLQATPSRAIDALKASRFDTTEYALTDTQLVEYSGRFGRELTGIPVAGITGAAYEMDYVESRYAVGNVTVYTERGYEGFTLEEVPDPVAVAREINETANAHRVAEHRDSRAKTDRGETVGASMATGEPAAPAASVRKRCRECDSRIDALAAFCPDCGTSQPRPDRPESGVCRQCDGPVADGDAFCRYCGTERPVQPAD
jgi:membrane protein YdbS with pleckstrin-like domain